MQRGQQTLVDIRSGLFQEMARLLSTLDAPEHIHAVKTSSGTIEAELVRLRLKFFINPDRILESRELNATVDNNQDIGCMYGLKNKLVIQEGSQRGQRSVLIPYGEVKVRKQDHHVHVSVQPPEEGRIKYFRYMLDERLQMLRGQPGMLSCLYQSYLHATTAFVLPDPATKRSGTEEALRILQQASLRTSFPLDPDCITMLNHLVALTPGRTYYPKHLRVMQTVQWNPSLGELAQHDDFQLLTREIANHTTRFANFHGILSVQAPLSDPTRGDQHLLERARSRHARFRCSEFAGTLTPIRLLDEGALLLAPHSKLSYFYYGRVNSFYRKVVSIIPPFKRYKLTLIIGTIRTPPRVFWKDHQHEFPVLASLARDVLSIPATGAGVERLFNSARDVCHYRRGSLKPKTIQDIMMFMCTSRFEIAEDRRALINEYLSHEEIQAAQEEKDTRANDLEPISDDDEDKDEDEEEDAVSNNAVSDDIRPTVQPPSGRALGKRRKSTASEPEDKEQDNEDSDLPLPDIQHRVSGRVRKRSKLLDGYEVGRA